MFHHCNRWSRRYAYAHAYGYGGRSPSTRSESAGYASRRHRGRHQGGSFGVRRPLRYLAYHLDLDDGQVRRIAAIMDRLKTEREQASLDEARTVTKVASLVTNPDVSVDMLKDALSPRVTSAEQLQLATARAIQDIIVELDPEQREDFAYLLNAKGFVI